tara:strand:- start:205 stop:789 length:585 start_codon:yes stop_codon:yes gene_type:complete
MLANTDIETFINDLPQGERRILDALSAQEDWPVDDAEEVSQLIGKLSEKLRDDKSKESFFDVSSHLMSGLLANLTLPRYSLILKELGNKPGALSKVMDESVALSEEERINRYTIFIRASYMVQYGLLQRMYSQERFDLVMKILLNDEDDDSEDVGISQDESIEEISKASEQTQEDNSNQKPVSAGDFEDESFFE